MEGNILSKGIAEVYVMKDMLLMLSECKEKREVLELEENKLEKSIISKEKLVEDEVSSTLKKRREEIELTYNKHLEVVRDKIKKIKNKKEKSKKEKIKERIESETKELRGEFKALQHNAKAKVKEHKLPSICKHNLFYSLYMPKFLNDFITIAILLLLLLYVIPCGIYFLLLPTQRITYLVGIYIVIVLIPGSIYMLIENKIKDRYITSLKEIQEIRGNIRINKKNQKKIIRAILKDKDESIYDLDTFNKELQELNKELDIITKEKEDAIKAFDEESKHVISKEIKARYEDELKNLKNLSSKTMEDRKALEERIKTVSLNIANSYEVYLGKELMNVEQLDKLATIMKEKQLRTISEGIASMKEE